MTKASLNKKPESKKQDKELKKKAENLMENLINALDEDDFIDDIYQRPKISEFINKYNGSYNSETNNYLLDKNEKNFINKKGNTYLNEIELNPSIAPKISLKLENSKNKNLKNSNFNLKNNSKIKEKNDLGLETSNNVDYEMIIEENTIEKTQIQNTIEKNKNNILCGRQKVIVPLNNLCNSKRTREELESSINNNILLGRTLSSNKLNNVNNENNLLSNQENYKTYDLPNSILTPIKNIISNEFKNLDRNNSNYSENINNNILDSNQQNNHNNNIYNSAIPNISLRNSNMYNLPYSQDKSLFVYWFDIIEETIKSKQYVIIFGKIYEPNEDKFSSISIIIKSIEKILYIIPGEDRLNGKKFDLKSVRNEFLQLKQNLFPHINTIKTKETKKNYCFELPIEHGEHECLEIRYDSDLGQIPSNLKSKTFDYIFGKNSSLLETILIEKNIRGPCWLKIDKDTFYDKNGNNHLTWSKYEIEINNYAKAIQVFDIKNNNNFNKEAENFKLEENFYNSNPKYNYLKFSPPLSVLSISTKTILVNDQIELYSICGSYVDRYLLEDEKGENERQTIIPIIVVRKIDHPHIKLENLENIKNDKEFSGSIFMIAHNETAVINQFINKISQYDPDVIVGHKLFTEHLDFLVNRINKLKINNWSKIGRLKRDCLPKFIAIHSRENNILRISTYGRLICDTLLSCKDMIKDTNFDLDYLSKKVLNQELNIFDPNRVFSKDIDFRGESLNNNMEKFETRNINKILLVKNLINGIFLESIHTYLLLNKLSILSLTKELTTIAGNLWIKSLQNNRADRCELLLMHEFHKNNFILPDKLTKFEKEELDENGNENSFAKKGNKKKPQYSGGLVLEPKADLYDTIILLLDFNSLYPSIIQEFNICFTTVSRKPSQQFTYKENNYNKNYTSIKKDNSKKINKNEEKDKYTMDIDSEIRKNNNNEEEKVDEDDLHEYEVDINDFNLDIIKKTTGNPILPGILASLVSKRKKIKEQMKYERDDLKKDLLEIKQKAIKLSANSLYGYLGFKNSRFYAKAIAALITSIGRNILMKTVNLVKTKFSLDVIYGDTDSIMIDTLINDLSIAIEIGRKIKSAVNEKYKLLEMEMDGIFKTLLLLKKKKICCIKI